ncbi:MAG TPA: PIG-L family deacetylase [Gemmatimonadaceae bacterium]|nr:PIG-L family deacetylase [Gemmatimonadaceae bacterium]
MVAFTQLAGPHPALAQGQTRTLVAVLAHPDDETPVGPVLARYAREGAQVYLIIATDGSQGGTNTTIPRGPELARVRSEEARCATDALGAKPPILLGFPDGKLGDYIADPSLLYRLTGRVAEELQRLRPDAIVTWGPDGGVGHPDHRMVSNIVTQLVRAGAPGGDRTPVLYVSAGGGNSGHESAARRAAALDPGNEVLLDARVDRPEGPRGRPARDELPSHSVHARDATARTAGAGECMEWEYRLYAWPWRSWRYGPVSMTAIVARESKALDRAEPCKGL